MSNIKEKAMLVNLTSSHWTAVKFDKKVTKEVDETHGSENSGRFSKYLIISDLLKDISACVSKARTYNYEVTLPWDDKGLRLLPVAKYFDYVKKMEEFQIQHKELVRKFIQNYPDLQELAKKRLNTLYSEADYPEPQTLANKFNLGYKITLIADENDLRVSLSEEEIAQVKKNIKSSLSDRINNAKNNMIERAEIAIKKLYEALEDEEATFRDNRIGSIVALAELIPSMNFDDDETLNKLQKKLLKFDIDPKKLRKDMELRKLTVKKAKKFLSKLPKMKYGTTEVPYVEVEMPEKKKDKKKKATRRIKK